MSTSTLERTDLAGQTEDARPRCDEVLTHSEADAPEADLLVTCRLCGRRLHYCEPCWEATLKKIREAREFAAVVQAWYYVTCLRCKTTGDLEVVFKWGRIR
jgi:hypothetical protein